MTIMLITSPKAYSYHEGHCMQFLLEVLLQDAQAKLCGRHSQVLPDTDQLQIQSLTFKRRVRGPEKWWQNKNLIKA